MPWSRAMYMGSAATAAKPYAIRTLRSSRGAAPDPAASPAGAAVAPTVDADPDWAGALSRAGPAHASSSTTAQATITTALTRIPPHSCLGGVQATRPTSRPTMVAV